MKSINITIPFTKVRVSFLYAHWEVGADMAVEFEGVWAWDWPHYIGVGHSFGLLKGRNGVVVGVFHKND